MNMHANGKKTAARTHGLLGLFAGCAIGALAIQCAHAATDDSPSVVVKYDARSLDTDSGVQALYRRLESAARQVCDDASSRDLAQVAAARRCRTASIERAVHEINDPRLAQALTRRFPSAG